MRSQHVSVRPLDGSACTLCFGRGYWLSQWWEARVSVPCPCAAEVLAVALFGWLP
jgi:hypothetical protein